jgi:hypothetical protein
VHRPVSQVEPVAKLVEIVIENRMADGLAAQVGFQISLRDIGHVFGLVNQDMVPGLVLGRPTFCKLLATTYIPLSERLTVEAGMKSRNCL